MPRELRVGRMDFGSRRGGAWGGRRRAKRLRTVRLGEGTYGIGRADLALVVVLGLPLCLVLFVDAYFLPVWVFAIASLPLAALLAWRGDLTAPRSMVLLGALLFVVGLLLSMLLQVSVKNATLVTQVSRGLLLVWFMYLVALVPMVARNWLDWLLFALVVACGISAAINVGIFLGGNPLAAGEEGTRLIPLLGVARHRWPTTISATYAIFVVAGMALLVRPPRRVAWVRVVLALALVAILIALLLTRTRSGYLGAIVGVLVVAGFLSRRVLVVTLAGLVLGGLGVLVLTPALDVILARGGSYRLGVWWTYLTHAIENPWIGTGATKRVLLMVDGAELTHAHNLWLSAWVRGGILSFIGMGLMLFVGLYFAWRLARRSGEVVILAMMAALFVTAIFDYDLYLTPLDWVWLTFWFPIALAAGCELAMRGTTATVLTMEPATR